MTIAKGRGMPKDVKAVEWVRKGAEQGHAGAQTALGLMLAEGRGVPRDDVKAVEWYRKAAEQGFAAAQYRNAWKSKQPVRSLKQSVSQSAKILRDTRSGARFDGSFTNSDWTSSINISQGPFSGVSYSDTQVASGGNPSDYRLDTRTWGLGTQAQIYNLNSLAVYDPSKQGAIGSVSFSEDIIGFGSNDGDT